MPTAAPAAPHIIKTTALRAFPGWQVVENKTTGMFWANSLNTVAIGPGESSFKDAVFFARNGRPPVGHEVQS